VGIDGKNLISAAISCIRNRGREVFQPKDLHTKETSGHESPVGPHGI
jgi:hypothetical protein